ncbi:Protein of unknown function [Bacillus cytotoxicus]|uniref:Uncharacterized protein n=1 Tax=Bacillus cytotoxicus TaxID=580165 RepID=A0AAX2CGC7_9BACI|nr:Protein of unknown function [Bacillus cytotoxicus]
MSAEDILRLIEETDTYLKGTYGIHLTCYSSN